MKPPGTELRNPGPSWGYRSLLLLDRVVPEALFRPLRSLGTWVSVLAMPRQRGYSRAYLRLVMGREPALADVHRHFLAVCEALMLRLRVANGMPYRCGLEPGARDFGGWLASERPVLLGMFHIGNSDLTGFMLAGQEGRRVRIVRLRVGNSHDTDALSRRVGGLLQFVWVNDPGELVFALKEAGASGETLALSCDRPDHSARSESFDFLGGRRVFAFTIYHLALIFDRPVLLSFGAPDGPGRSVVHSSPFFTPARGEPRDVALGRAREHFQSFLLRVEAYLREHPYEWLNFLPL